MKGYIHSVQSLSTVDGPGVRSVVFLSGCPLRCVYCHNPDTWRKEDGTEREAAEVFAQICRFSAYFGEKGGLTVSGGEPLAQAAFVTELFSLCRDQGIGTCLDTAGSIINEHTDRLLKATDLCLLDIKFAAQEDYLRYTGGSLQQVISFLERLQKAGVPVITRHVIVPGINDSEAFIDRLQALLRPFDNIRQNDLLPFRRLCADKYHRLGIPFPLEKTPDCPAATIRSLAAYWSALKK